MEFPHHPGAIFVQLTTGCNAACLNCPHPFTYGKEGTHKKGNLSEAVWQELVRQIRDDDYREQVGLYLHFEPLLVKSLFDKIKQINSETNAFVVLSTNGELLDEAAQEKMIEARPRQIHININSADKAQYEQMMKLDYEKTFRNAHSFIKRAAGKINIEINCPVMPGVDTQKLVNEFPGTKVNIEYYANSRGGLVDGVSAQGHDSRFKELKTSCTQPITNLNVLWDGRVILCCMDWAHETKSDFPNIFEKNVFETFRSPLMRHIQSQFYKGDYSAYKMCQNCSKEMEFWRAKDGAETRASATDMDTRKLIMM